MISWLIQRVRNLDSLYRDASSSHWIVWDVARPDAPNLSTDGAWSHHLLAPAERATRPQGTLLKSAHSLHSLEACNVYTKRVLMQWNGCRDCHWNCESVPNEQQQQLLQVLKHSVRDSSLVSHNPSTQLALVQCTHISHRLSTLHPTIALFIVPSPPRQLIMLAQADNAPSVERQLYN